MPSDGDGVHDWSSAMTVSREGWTMFTQHRLPLYTHSVNLKCAGSQDSAP
jgi:hypothetical protein